MKCYSVSLELFIWFSTLCTLHGVYGSVQNRIPRQVWDVVNDYYSTYNPNVNFNYNPNAEPPKNTYEAVGTPESNLFIFDRPSAQSSATIAGFQPLSSRDSSEPERIDEPHPFPTLPSFPTLPPFYKENAQQATTPAPYYQPFESQPEQQYDDIYIDENGLFQARSSAVSVDDKQGRFEEYSNVDRTSKDIIGAQAPALFNGLPVFSD